MRRVINKEDSGAVVSRVYGSAGFPICDISFYGQTLWVHYDLVRFPRHVILDEIRRVLDFRENVLSNDPLPELFDL